MTEAVCDAPATEQRTLIEARSISARELLDAHLERIEATNGTVNAVVAMDADVAYKRAAHIDDELAAGRDPGPLAGLVTAHKDLVETADFVTSHGSPIFAGHRPAVDALQVARMKAAGAVALGKTNTPEFGAGSHSFNPVYGVTSNPYDLDLSAGGSSGGAAAALRCAMVAIADGSDAGGSLRNPAAWNNVVGFRTSPRVVPRVAPGDTWSRIPIEGPMARTVDDLVLLLRVMAQPDVRDPLCRELSLPEEITPAQNLRVAWSPTLGGLPVESDIAEVLERFIGDVADLGWSIEEAEPDFSGADDCFVTLRAFLFANNLGSALGERLSEVKATVQDEIRRGRALSASEVSRALAQANTLWQRNVAFFGDYDLLIGPVTQISPFPIELEYPTEVAGQPVKTYLDWMLSNCRISACGLPALSLPAGFTEAGLPVGAQLIGRPWGDLDVLRAAKAIEAATGHTNRWPDLTRL
ncbi:MAG: amidase [Actinomycetia bacterium]|nr:amidase [Actinomycetes bacterium]MCP5031656.1 amidase [Actinomycetes bacterium]